MILVTGGTGFVGPKIVRALRAAGRPVRCLVRRPDGASELESWGCELAQGDITDPESVRRAVEGCETVVHLVAVLTGKPELFQRVVIGGARNVVAAAKEAGVRRFVLMSALGTSEETKTLVPYYGAKWEMEREVKESGLDHVVFRRSFIFGRDGGVLPTFLRLVRLSPAIPVVGPGTQRIQPIWIDDVAAYFERAIDLEAARNRTFELGGPDVVTWNELYDRIKHVLRKRRAKLHLPIGFMRVNAALLERLPLPGKLPLTRDTLTMLQGPDNVVSDTAAADTFQLSLVPLDEQIRRAA